MTPREQAEIAIQEIREHLAGCRQSPVDANLILADRRDFAERIDRLETVVQRILEEYESVMEQRGEIERAARRESEQIIGTAESRADDVYAASIVYTDNMIGTLQTIIDDTNDSLNGVIRRFRKEMRRQKDLLKKNEIELQAELLDMKDSKKYLQMIEEINEEREEKRLAAKRLAEEAEAGTVQDGGQAPVPGTARTAGATGTAEAIGATGTAGAAGTAGTAGAIGVTGTAGAAGVAAGGEKADILVNKDAAYFKWKEADDKTRFVDVQEQESWQMERKENGSLDLQHTRVFRPVSREQVHLEREESSRIDTAKLPDEDALMRAMLQGEEPDRELVDDADHFEYYDDDLGDLEGLDELDDFDDFDDFGDDSGLFEDDDAEPGVVGRQVAGKIKDFLLGK